MKFLLRSKMFAHSYASPYSYAPSPLFCIAFFTYVAHCLVNPTAFLAAVFANFSPLVLSYPASSSVVDILFVFIGLIELFVENYRLVLICFCSQIDCCKL